MDWRILDTGRASAAENMSLDQHLLKHLGLGDPILHFYDWSQDAVTYGYFIDPHAYLRLPLESIDLARRPTGGGLVFHEWDLAFSLLLPSHFPGLSSRPLENYARINSVVKEALEGVPHRPSSPIRVAATETLNKEQREGFCFAIPTPYDLLLQDGRKVGGAAQRMNRKWGLLHQGSIGLISPNSEKLEQLILSPERVQAMRQHGAALYEGESSEQLPHLRELVKTELIKAITEYDWES